MINWTRLNPQGAIAAVAGSDYDYYPWWAWACHDPEAAFVTAMSENKKFVSHVAQSVGEFHPEWLRANLDRLPEDARKYALIAYAIQSDGQKPRETLEFLKEHDFLSENQLLTFKALVREDTATAYEWAMANEINTLDSFDTSRGNINYLEAMIETLREERAGELAVLRNLVTSAESKMKIDLAEFSNLLKKDPEAALAKMEATPKSWLKQDQAIALGEHFFAQGDKEKTPALMKQLFTVNEEVSGLVRRVSEGRSDDSDDTDFDNPFGYEEIPDLKSLLGKMMADDPVRVMDELSERDTGDFDGGNFRALSRLWLAKDQDSYLDWLEKLPNGQQRAIAIPLLQETMSNKGQYEASLNFANQNFTADETDYRLTSTFQNWITNEPAKAEAWAGSTKMAGLFADQISRGMVNEMAAQGNVKKVNQWLGKIQDPDILADAQIKTVKEFKDDYPANLEAWLRSQTMSEKVKQEVLEILKPETP